jgi:hypothetical protein
VRHHDAEAGVSLSISKKKILGYLEQASSGDARATVRRSSRSPSSFFSHSGLAGWEMLGFGRLIAEKKSVGLAHALPRGPLNTLYAFSARPVDACSMDVNSGVVSTTQA